MKTGDFIAIDYVGKVKESGEIFDVTREDIAKKNNVHNPKMTYRPVDVVVGADFTIKGLDEALKEMSVGDKRTVLVDPEKGFGERSAKFIKLIPLSSFKDQRIDPTPGSYITVNGVRGKIISADGGRIRVDFNHPLAGKKLEYDVEIKRKITEAPEKVKAITGFITGADPKKISVKLHEKEADVSIELEKEQELGNEAKKKVAEFVMKWVKEIEKVRFVDEYGK